MSPSLQKYDSEKVLVEMSWKTSNNEANEVDHLIIVWGSRTPLKMACLRLQSVHCLYSNSIQLLPVVKDNFSQDGSCNTGVAELILSLAGVLDISLCQGAAQSCLYVYIQGVFLTGTPLKIPSTKS